MTREELIQFYTRGHCMVMAYHLSQILDGEIVGIFDDVWNNVPRHVGLRTPSGNFIDARGTELSLEAFLDGFVRNTGTRLGSMSGEDLQRIWSARDIEWVVPDEHLILLGLGADK